MKVKIIKYSEVICENVFWAKDFFSRMFGLLGRKSFDDIDGLLISPCSQIHSLGMKFEFDAVYLDNTYRIVELYENVGKNRIMPYNVAVKNVLELPLGTISEKKLGVGDVLKVVSE